MHAGTVTYDGLCPALNTVINEIKCGLYPMYAITQVLRMGMNDCL